MKLQLLAAAASVAIMAVPSLASANDQGWYIRGNVGYGVMTDTNLSGDLLGAVQGEGNAAESLGLGYQFGNNWRLELDATQLWNDLGAIGQAGNTSADMRLTSGMLNAIYDFSGFGNWEPYLGAGIGIAQGNLHASAHSSPSGRLFINGAAPINSAACPAWNKCELVDHDTALAWQLIAGLGYKISDNLTWDTQYRYLNAGDLTYTGTGANLANPVAAGTFGASSPINTAATGVGSHTVMTGLRYRFGASAPKPQPVTYTCWDGSSVEDMANCPAEPPKPVMVTCWDGSQVESGTACPAKPVVQCWDGSTAESQAQCPTRPSVTCWDGSTVYDATSCPAKPQYYDLCANEYRQEIIYYDFNKPKSAETQQKIQNILDTAKHCNIGNIHVVGHTDTSGSAAYNLRLSKKRASDVRKELIRQGVPANIITSEGKGETQPFIDTGDGVKEPLNRRTEVLIRLNSTGVTN